MSAGRSSEGFTLLELLVVSVLIAIMLALTVPRIEGLFFNDPLKRSARLLVAAIHEARATALSSDHGCVVLVDTSSGRVEVQLQSLQTLPTKSADADQHVFQLAVPVSVGSVWTPTGGRRLSGEAPIYVNARGMVEPVLIELRGEGRIMTIKASPFLAEIEVFDRALPLPESLLADSLWSR